MKTSKKDVELFEFYSNLDISEEQIAILEVISKATTDKMKLDELLERMVGREDD